MQGVFSHVGFSDAATQVRGWQQDAGTQSASLAQAPPDAGGATKVATEGPPLATFGELASADALGMETVV